MANEAEKVHVVVSVYEGCLDEVKVSRTDKRATEIERELCQKCGVPFGPKRREKYYQADGTNEVHHLIVEIERQGR